MTRRIAIVLMNMGGPSGPETVQPFLQNLFSDPAILRTSVPMRWLLSRFISRSRAGQAQKNYALMDAGGGSPQLAETRKQAEALRNLMQQKLPGDHIQIFIAMRYWHPFSEETAKNVKDWAPDETILLPLYPQYSTTTTGSSLGVWKKHYRAPTRTVCCYPFNEHLIDAHEDKIREAHKRAGSPTNVTLLLSAHGLPEAIIKQGDPYQWQIKEMNQRLKQRLPKDWEIITSYQSRVGRLKWIGPSTQDEVEKAARAGRNIMVAPIAFVSEHIETLVELGMEYRLLAEQYGAASYTCAQALGIDGKFIEGLAIEAMAALEMNDLVRSCKGGRLCPAGFSGCAHHQAQNVQEQTHAV